MSENDMKDWVFVPEEENRCEPVEVALAIQLGVNMISEEGFVDMLARV